MKARSFFLVLSWGVLLGSPVGAESIPDPAASPSPRGPSTTAETRPMPARDSASGSAPIQLPSKGWAAKVARTIRSNIHLVTEIDGNPRAVVELRLAPDGRITNWQVIESSGSPDWDRTVVDAIARTDSLPPDVDGDAPPRLEIGFRPKENTPSAAPAPLAEAAPAGVVPTVQVSIGAVCQTAPPLMPSAALRQAISGSVRAVAIIRDGVVVDVKILKSVPAGVFDSAVIAAMTRYRCRSGLNVSAIQDFDFVSH